VLEAQDVDDEGDENHEDCEEDLEDRLGFVVDVDLLLRVDAVFEEVHGVLLREEIPIVIIHDIGPSKLPPGGPKHQQIMYAYHHLPKLPVGIGHTHLQHIRRQQRRLLLRHRRLLLNLRVNGQRIHNILQKDVDLFDVVVLRDVYAVQFDVYEDAAFALGVDEVAGVHGLFAAVAGQVVVVGGVALQAVVELFALDATRHSASEALGHAAVVQADWADAF
jgi:hypothetical protein